MSLAPCMRNVLIISFLYQNFGTGGPTQPPSSSDIHGYTINPIKVFTRTWCRSLSMFLGNLWRGGYKVVPHQHRRGQISFPFFLSDPCQELLALQIQIHCSVDFGPILSTSSPSSSMGGQCLPSPNYQASTRLELCTPATSERSVDVESCCRHTRYVQPMARHPETRRYRARIDVAERALRETLSGWTHAGLS